MYKTKDQTFVNSYGYDESYTVKTLESYLSGHLCRGSMFETDSDCGNCDGARCDCCEEIFTVTRYGVPYMVTDPKYGYSYQQQDVLGWRRFTDIDEALTYFEAE